jgi:hypothetical protein
MDIDYAELFGVEGAKVEEAAAPPEEGAKEQEVAEPEESKAEEPKAEEPKAEEPKEEPKDENAKYAAARRKAEAEKKALEEKYAKEFAEMMADLGVVNPLTNEPVKTKSEYEEVKALKKKQELESKLKKTGLDLDTVNELVAEHPDVKAYKDTARTIQAERQRILEEESRKNFERELGIIKELDPSVKSYEDIRNMDSYDRMIEILRGFAPTYKGDRLVDAFKLANLEKLASKKEAAIRQQVLNSTKSKEHLSPTQIRSDAEPVPEAVKREYRLFVPTATDSEIEAHYRKMKG